MNMLEFHKLCNDPQKSDQNKRDNLDKKKYKK
jgi:hypothetical protein